jgi:HAD superfamily hydrolase (TIGR01509 family)
VSVEALLLDFNGTLSDDERVLATIYAEMLAAHGRSLTPDRYVEELAGLTDAEIFRAELGAQADVPALVEERVERYRAASADGATISPDARRAVALAASRVPVVVVTSALRREVEPALAGSGLSAMVTAIVAVEDVADPKPHPEPYLTACALAGVEPARAVAVEDTAAGVAAAKAAGVFCVALTGTMPASRLAEADLLLPSLTPEAVASLLGGEREDASPR